jgi:Domain of unknown function (DUF4145)
LQKDHSRQNIQKYYTIKYTSSALRIIEIPKNTPALVKSALELVLTMYWFDLNACANKLRIVIDLILDDLKVPANENLNKRIRSFEKTDLKNAQLVSAIKWIGNEGTHGKESVLNENIVEALMITEHLLQNLYENSISNIYDIAEKINQRYLN